MQQNIYIYSPRASLLYWKKERKKIEIDEERASILPWPIVAGDDDDDDDDDLRGGFSGRQGRRWGGEGRHVAKREAPSPPGLVRERVLDFWNADHWSPGTTSQVAHCSLVCPYVHAYEEMHGYGACTRAHTSVILGGRQTEIKGDPVTPLRGLRLPCCTAPAPLFLSGLIIAVKEAERGGEEEDSCAFAALF